MKNCEVEDYTRLAYFLIHKYYFHAKNKKDLVSDLLLEAVKKEPEFIESMGVKKQTFLTTCMKHRLFNIMRKRKKGGVERDYYLNRKNMRYIEDMDERGLKNIAERKAVSKDAAKSFFEDVLNELGGSNTIERVLEYSSMNDLNSAKVFEVLLDKKFEDMFIHSGGYALLLEDKPKRVLNTSYIIHWRYLTDDKKTFEDIGSDFGVSRERVRQIEDNSLLWFRKKLDAVFDIDLWREDDICNWRYPCEADTENS